MPFGQRARSLEKHLYDGSVRNPQELLGMQHDLESLRQRIDAQDEQLLRRVADAERQVAEDLGRPARDCGPDVDERRPIAFFCAAS